MAAPNSAGVSALLYSTVKIKEQRYSWKDAMVYGKNINYVYLTFAVKTCRKPLSVVPCSLLQIFFPVTNHISLAHRLHGCRSLVYNQIRRVLKLLPLSCAHVNWIIRTKLKPELKKR